MMKRLAIAFFVSMAFVSSAAHAKKEKPLPVFQDSVSQELPPPPADKAQIVLIEPINKIQGLFPVAHYVLNGTERKMVAVSAWRSKTVFNLEPGKHMLMATQGALGHPMEANVEAGKRYYVLVRFIYAQGMQLRPLRTSGESPYRTNIPDFAEWWKITRYVEMTPAAVPTFESERSKPMIDAAQAAMMVKWQEKTDAQRAELTLNTTDAIPL
jgi:hypothetical protein